MRTKKKKLLKFTKTQSDFKRGQNLDQLVLKYENKNLKGDFLTFELFFYDVLSPSFF